MEIKKVWFQDGFIFIKRNAGHIFGNPLVWFPRLANATEDQLGNYVNLREGIHWPELDEDLSLKGFITYKTDLDTAKTDLCID